MVGLLVSIAAGASPFSMSSKCDAGSDEAKPLWVNNPDYKQVGFYLGVGSAEKAKKNIEEQKQASVRDAQTHLVLGIGATVKSESRQRTRVNNQQVEKEDSSELSVIADEDLRGLQFVYWVDKETCNYYTLARVTTDSVAEAKLERLMKNRLEKFKKLLVMY